MDVVVNPPKPGEPSYENFKKVGGGFGKWGLTDFFRK